MPVCPAKNPFEDVPGPEIWSAGVSDPDVWAAGVKDLDDEQTQFSTEENPEIDTALRLDGDRRFVTRPNRRLFVDYRASPEAYRHLDPLPGQGDTLHGVVSGKYALFEMIPALIEHCGPIDELTVATLSFNAGNAADFLSLLDDGHIRKMSLLISFYFASTSRPIYDQLVPQLRERGHRVLSMRNHAKLLLVKTVAGDHFVCETSANLRSSVNLEQFCLTRCPNLYAFHAGWMEELFTHGVDMGEKDGGQKDQTTGRRRRSRA